MRTAHTRSLHLGALFLMVLFAGCAIPVRPIAFIEKDKQGRTHFTQDEAQEPTAADSVSWFAPIAGIVGGPYGEAAIGALALLLGHQVGHRRATKKAANKSKATTLVAGGTVSGGTGV